MEIAEHSSAQNYIICNTDFKNFRTTVAKIGVDTAQNRALISEEVAKALQVKPTDTVRLVAVR